MLGGMARRLASGLVAAGALVVCAWFALGIRQSHDLNLATDILSARAPLTSAQARQTAALLHQAAVLNPDAAVDLARSELALRRGDRSQARAIARRVTESEPQNIDAWLAFGTASAQDPRGFQLALRHLEQLAPTVRR